METLLALNSLLQCPTDVEPLATKVQIVPVNCRGKIEQPLGVAETPRAHRHQPRRRHDGLDVDVVKHVLVRNPQHQLLDDIVDCRRIRCDTGLSAAYVVGAAKLLRQSAAFAAKVPAGLLGLALVLLAVVVLHLLQSDHTFERVDIEHECHGDV